MSVQAGVVFAVVFVLAVAAGFTPAVGVVFGAAGVVGWLGHRSAEGVAVWA